MIDRVMRRNLLFLVLVESKGRRGGAVRLTPPIAYIAILEEHDIEGET